VVYSVQKWMDPATKSRRYTSFPMYQSIEKVDQYTVKFTLKYPSPAFLMILTGAGCAIEAEHLAGSDPSSTDFLVGTGPFIFGHYKPVSEVYMTRNPNYFEKDALGNQLPYLDSIRIYLSNDVAFATDAYIAGRLDMVNPTQVMFIGADLQRLQDNAPADTQYPPHADGKGTIAICSYFNMKTFEPFQDIRVRQAFCLIWDSEIMCEVYTGNAELTDPGHYLFGPFYRYNLPEDEVASAFMWDQPWDDRVAKAQRLMAEAGYANGFDCRYLYSITAPGSAGDAVAAVLADKLNLINVNLILQGTDYFSKMQRTAMGDYDLLASSVYLSTGDPNETINYFKSDGRSNYAGLVNAEIDALLEAQGKEMDPEKRRQIMTDVERLLIQELPCLPAIFATGSRVYRGYVKNFRTCGPKAPLTKVWLDL